MSAFRPNLEHRLGFLLADISRLTRKEFDRRVRDLGLTRAQWLFLYYLARQPGCTQSELAESLQMERISVSRQANRLEKAGWIERRDHAQDRRAYHLHLTPKAERLALRLTDLAGRLRDDYLSGLPVARRAALIHDLLQVKSNLLQMDERARQLSNEN
jgi:DNA-binding MarR family transcriptional regulator